MANLATWVRTGLRLGRLPMNALPRLEQERVTMAAMIEIYCHGHHQPRGLCDACQSLLDYATQRLDRCVFQAEKPACARCPVHCYRPIQREQVRLVMRYAGPRMLWRHPRLALRHWWLSRVRPIPVLPSARGRG